MAHRAAALQVLQRAMKSNQGVIKEFSVDDKGTVMVGALGLPPITGSNPSARACLSALKIMEGIKVCVFDAQSLLRYSRGYIISTCFFSKFSRVDFSKSVFLPEGLSCSHEKDLSVAHT